MADAHVLGSAEAQLVSKIGERTGLPLAQAQADVTAWMVGKTF